MSRIDPAGFGRRLGARDIQVDDDRLLAAAHDDGLHWAIRVGIYFLVRHVWGNKDEVAGSGLVDEAGPGDFIFVPPYVPHQEINANPDCSVEAVVVRSGQEPIVVNLDIASPEPDPGGQPDPFHSAPSRS